MSRHWVGHALQGVICSRGGGVEVADVAAKQALNRHVQRLDSNVYLLELLLVLLLHLLHLLLHLLHLLLVLLLRLLHLLLHLLHHLLHLQILVVTRACGILQSSKGLLTGEKSMLHLMITQIGTDHLLLGGEASNVSNRHDLGIGLGILNVGESHRMPGSQSWSQQRIDISVRHHHRET